MRWFETQVVQTIPNLLASPILLTIGFVWHHRRVLRALDERFGAMRRHVDKATGTQEAGEHDGSDPGDQRGR